MQGMQQKNSVPLSRISVNYVSLLRLDRAVCYQAFFPIQVYKPIVLYFYAIVELA